MGLMVDGVYHADDGPIATDTTGQWQRSKSVVRHWITPDGSAGPTGDGGFKAEANRYHLYVAWNCPWAHRALLSRLFNKLDGIVDVSVALPRRSDQGWVFDPDGAYTDRLFGSASLHEIYTRGVDGYTGRITVPVLWDKDTGRIVSNESADIVRMFNTAFAQLAPATPDFYPSELHDAIDDWNERIYRTVNNGVYRAGFASTQEAYQTAAWEVFATLDAIDACLSQSRYLTGDRITEADLRLFPTLARFDVAYHYAFRCNLKRLADYSHLWPYAREIYRMAGVAETVKFDVYKRGYFSPSAKRNPLGIVPIGPQIDWTEPHGRR